MLDYLPYLVPFALALVSLGFFALCAFVVWKEGSEGLRNLAVVIRAWRTHHIRRR
jgi:hypothetical protein